MSRLTPRSASTMAIHLRFLGGALVSATLLLAAGCDRHAEHLAAASAPALRVQVTTARTENQPAPIEVTGTVFPAQRAQLAARITGAISELPIILGQRVRAGDLLVKISAPENAARLARAQTQLDTAQRELAREQELLANGASTSDVVKSFTERRATAETVLREAEALLSYTEVRAPFDGIIARRPVNLGDFASPGLPLVDLEGTADFQVEAGLPAALTAGLAPSAVLCVEIPDAALTFSGTLVELSSTADTNARTVLAKLAVPASAHVRSGQFARVSVPGTPVPTLVVPASAVSRLGQMERVFVVDENRRAVLRLVKTGAVRNDLVEILAGLDAGETVVLSPPAHLREGQPLDFAP